MTASLDHGIVRMPPLRRDRAVQSWVLASGVSTCGDVVWLIGLGWTAVHVAGPGAAGLLLGVGTLPKVLLVVAGGVWADRSDARRIVLGATLARIVVLILGAAVYGRTTAHFAVLAVVWHRRRRIRAGGSHTSPPNGPD